MPGNTESSTNELCDRLLNEGCLDYRNGHRARDARASELFHLWHLQKDGDWIRLRRNCGEWERMSEFAL